MFTNVTFASSVAVFKQHLKTFLFRCCWADPVPIMCSDITVSPWFCAVIPGQQSSSRRRCRWSSASAFIRRDPTLVVPSTRRSTLSDRAFPVAAPKKDLRQSGPRRPYRRFVKNWRHSSSARIKKKLLCSKCNKTYCKVFYCRNNHKRASLNTKQQKVAQKGSKGQDLPIVSKTAAC